MKRTTKLDVSGVQRELRGMVATLKGIRKRARDLQRACQATPEHRASWRAYYSQDPHDPFHVPFNPDRVRKVWSLPWEIQMCLEMALEDLPDVTKQLQEAARASERTCLETDIKEHADKLAAAAAAAKTGGNMNAEWSRHRREAMPEALATSRQLARRGLFEHVEAKARRKHLARPKRAA